MLTIEIAANNTTINFVTNNTTWKGLFAELANKTGLCEEALRYSITAYNDMAVDFGATDSADEIPLNNHDKFELKIELPELGEAAEEEAPAYSAASITVTKAGDCREPLRVNITGEHTRVRDIITDTMANFFSSSKNEFETMDVKINNVNADLDTEVRADDAVCFCAKNAGTKGCGESIKFSVISRNGSCVSTSVCREKLEELGVEDVADLRGVCEDMCVMEFDFAPNLEITSINGTSAAESDFILQMDINAVDEIGFHEHENEVLDLDPEALDEQEDPVSDEEDYEEHAAHAEGPVTVKQIKVSYGPLNAEYAVVTNKTTVYDVMSAPIVQSIFQITNADLRKFNFSLDGVTVSPDTVITAMDNKLVISPNCGTKGC